MIAIVVPIIVPIIAIIAITIPIIVAIIPIIAFFIIAIIGTIIFHFTRRNDRKKIIIEGFTLPTIIGAIIATCLCYCNAAAFIIDTIIEIIIAIIE